MNTPVKRSISIFVVLLIASGFANGFALQEFHHGYGGFSISIGNPPTIRQSDGFELNPYQLWGNRLIWEGDGLSFSISYYEVLDATHRIASPQKDILITKFKAAFREEHSTDNTVLKEVPYVFGNSRGVEILGSGGVFSITRAFFVNRRIFILDAYASDLGRLNESRSVMDSFRILTKAERTIAMIDENTPPMMAQERPAKIPPSDTAELGIIGAVRRIVDTSRAGSRNELIAIQEINFDVSGFKTREIGFNDGFPDVITSWGWIEGKRVNIQAAVNYPSAEGPTTGRKVDISGFISMSNGLIPQYGNRFETEFDAMNRPSTRRRISNNGILINVERFSYSANLREIRTVDNSGGFLNGVRERLDSNNNVTEADILTSTGKIYESKRFEYEFDEKGNWIVKKVFRKTSLKRRSGIKPDTIIYRTIQYYESSGRDLVG